MIIRTADERAQAVTDIARLREAEMSLATGERANRMNYAERGVGFAEMSRADIQAAIREREDAIAAYDGSCSRRRPLHVRWGSS